ncbi:SufB/SufD family protein [Spirochaeta thermophila]|uniref:Membrane subunit of an iron-regulated ABC-type transporter n=1 Tax=Winmispira thermophila (strain ATCC 49972 / DSM 6192 / RI 19.B1) TaxID=665571 RepID=E0RTU1_WINT6|nr:SufD family Fe-S cluster assembly protein [Spirochaeta thermophila]ADN02466.1 membrane subunit of an iron-regulated ABC-type transporter [Spirochaeta thermophila DSM 6192]
MSTNDDKALLEALLASLRMAHYAPDQAHLAIHGGRVVSQGAVEGLEVRTSPLQVEGGDGIRVEVVVKEGARIKKPVHLCFGMTGERGIQKIDMHVVLEAGSSVAFQAHCTFPNAREIRHLMDARIVVGEGARYRYVEKHIHGPEGGVVVIPKTRVKVKEGGRFFSEFYLVEGCAGVVDLDYEVEAEARSSVDLRTYVYGKRRDTIKVREAASLNGVDATAVLMTHIAVKDEARAEVINELTARAPGARGHVDCKEIVQDRAVARAVPLIQVEDPAAHITHEAAIGSVDSKQLQTLMARGLTEEEATDVIIRALFAEG